MPTTGIACPRCSRIIEDVGPVAGGRVPCPHCCNVLAPASRHDTVPVAWFIAVTAGGAAALLLIAATVGVILVAAGRRTPQVAAAPAPAGHPAAPAVQPPAVLTPLEIPRKPISDDPPQAVKPPPVHDAPPPANPPPLQAAPEQRAEPPPKPPDLPPDVQDKVNKAIDRGVAFLLKTQNADGAWTASEFFLNDFPAGLTALAELTLLECGAAPDDAHVQKAASFVRKQALDEPKTYSMALVILFLDRLGDAKDDQLIQSLALRLTAGQTAWGGWTYNCPALAPAEEAALLQALRKTRPASRADLAAAADVPAALRSLPAFRPAGRPPGEFADAMSDPADNSNTQFAILGLWTARRHDMPTERALALVDRRFRASQRDDGSWTYNFADRALNNALTPQDSPSMTAAGLLALAAGRGIDADLQAGGAAAPEQDAAVEKGMKALSASIDVRGGLGDIVLNRLVGVAALAAINQAKQAGVGVDVDTSAMGQALDLYYLWSVERIGVLYNRATIAGKEWYPWGARLLLAAQHENGCWGKGGSFVSTPTVDTSFALLFLKRSNLVKDLSAKLGFFVEIKQPTAPSPGLTEKIDPKP
jgi:hypothetical protein